MEIERNGDGDIDRISNLPEFLLHQILSLLPPKEAARTTILSKTWLQSYSSSPFLTFDDSFFSNSGQMLENMYTFFNFVNNTLLRYTRLNLRIQNLRIKVFGVGHAPANLLLDKSLGVAFDSGVKELDITFKFRYTLPSAIFDSPKLLTYLRVDKGKFPQNNSKCSAIIFPFLKTLHLYRAYIDDGMLQKLLSCSPSLEEIVFRLVYGFNKFRVCNLDKLKILHITSSKPIEIDIEDAPGLRLLKYWSCGQRPCLSKVSSSLRCQNLKRLMLYSVSISDNSLKELITKFPLLEHLDIWSVDELERVSIVSDSLKHLYVSGCKNLVEAIIDASSLLKLEYYGEHVLSLSYKNTPEELMTYLYIHHYGIFDQLSDVRFHQLRELQKSVTRARVSFTFWPLGIKFGTTLGIRENPLPLEYKATIYMPEMVNPSSSLLSDDFVNTLFSCYRPTSVYSSSLPPGYVDFMKFLSNELITATSYLNCCGSHQTKCWRHYLKDINVEVYEDSLKVWRPLNQEALQSECTFSNNMICISLTWYTSLNAQG